MDLMWLVLGGALVFFMHSGFSLLEVGSVSVRNTQNILFKNIISPTVAGILFWFCGYSFAYVRHLTCFTCFTVGVHHTLSTPQLPLHSLNLTP